MNKLLLLFLFCASIAPSIAQSSSNNCTDAIISTHISAEGIYSVGIINGTTISNTCIGQAATNSEWFAYTPQEDYNVTITSDLPMNGDIDTRLHVYSGTCGSLSCIAGDDDSGTYGGSNGQSYLSVVSFNATAGQTYLIVWDNRWGNSSNFSFEIIESTATSGDNLTFSTINPSTSGSRMGVVDMNGDFLDDLVTI
ncbi:MAG TPA: hypothetical protein VKZ98_03460, partial [Aquaticitalea sp.]|nr:hypothetical protein [Aquaticitalea sp.]